MNTAKRYPPEVQERAVRLLVEQQDKHDSLWAATVSVASKIGCTAETLRKWHRRVENSQKAPVSERERLKQLERENRELKRANEILRKAAAFFAQAELDRKPN